MKKLMTLLMVLTLATMALAQEGILEAFVANSKELSFGTETELNEGNLLRVGGLSNRPQGCTRDQLEMIVGYSDFCYIENIEGYRSRPVKNTFNRWFGLAEVTATIQEDLFYNNSGRLKQVWYHVEIPDILPQAEGNKFCPETYIGKKILVLGQFEDGYALVSSRDIYILGDDNSFLDVYGNQVDKEYLFKLLKTRKTIGNQSPFSKKNITIVVGRSVSSMNDFLTTGISDFEITDVLKGSCPVDIKVRFIGEAWYMRHLPRFKAGSCYLMAVEITNSGEYNCINGRLGVFEVVNGEYIWTNGKVSGF